MTAATKPPLGRISGEDRPVTVPDFLAAKKSGTVTGRSSPLIRPKGGLVAAVMNHSVTFLPRVIYRFALGGSSDSLYPLDAKPNLHIDSTNSHKIQEALIGFFPP